jgi:SAM-dependent methyltransferase
MRRLWYLRHLPYPVIVPRLIEYGRATISDCFDIDEAKLLNEARMKHLESLGIDLNGKTVLDVGAGVGRLAEYLARLGCRVKCIDGREENVAEMRRRNPEFAPEFADVERTDLKSFGIFDIVFCYGLLYHVENPVLALRNMAQATKGLLLLETMVCDSYQPVMYLVDEPATYNQALRGFGCRPSPSFVSLVLSRLGFFVYAPKTFPNHADFRFSWRDSLRITEGGHNIRAVFVASKEELNLPSLVQVDRQRVI